MSDFNNNKILNNNNLFFNPIANVIKPTNKQFWPPLAYFGDEFLFTFTSALDTMIRRKHEHNATTYITNLNMLKKRNVITFAMNGHLEIFKLKPDYTGFDFSRMYQVNTTDCNRTWAIFYDFDELIDFINKHQKQALERSKEIRDC